MFRFLLRNLWIVILQGTSPFSDSRNSHKTDDPQEWKSFQNFCITWFSSSLEICSRKMGVKTYDKSRCKLLSRISYSFANKLDTLHEKMRLIFQPAIYKWTKSVQGFKINKIGYIIAQSWNFECSSSIIFALFNRFETWFCILSILQSSAEM